MTTYPEGFLIGAWTAMENIELDSGPLVYYPGSHRLPFYSARDVGISERESLIDCYDAYSHKYEPFIQDVIHREGLEPAVFTPRQGSLLLWHANLLHGGSPRQEPSRSRKSVVSHYVARQAICYHASPRPWHERAEPVLAAVGDNWQRAAPQCHDVSEILDQAVIAVDHLAGMAEEIEQLTREVEFIAQKVVAVDRVVVGHDPTFGFGDLRQKAGVGHRGMAKVHRLAILLGGVLRFMNQDVQIL